MSKEIAWRLTEAKAAADRSQYLIREAIGLVRVAGGECDGISGEGTLCALSSTHRGHHVDASGLQWLDTE